MLVRVSLIGLASFAALVAASVAAGSEGPPVPEATRPCSSRGDSDRPQKLPVPAGERIGPLVIWPSIRNRAGRSDATRTGWAFVAKAPIVLPARARVTLAVPVEALHLVGFQAANGTWVSSVRFEACRESVRAFPGAYDGTVGKFTGFPFGFGLARRSMCVPLEVWVEGRAAPIRRLVPVGRRSCG